MGVVELLTDLKSQPDFLVDLDCYIVGGAISSISTSSRVVVDYDKRN